MFSSAEMIPLAALLPIPDQGNACEGKRLGLTMFTGRGNPCVGFLFNHKLSTMRFLTLVFLLALGGMLNAQHLISGRVLHAETHAPVEDALITLLTWKEGLWQTAQSGLTNERGDFSLSSLEGQPYRIRVNHVSFQVLEKDVPADSLKQGKYFLQPLVKVAEEVMVSATRVDKSKATTFTNISRKEINRSNLGQDMPFLLGQIPGVVVNSDAGAGIGYTGIRIRGIDPTRINVTVNGIPINDAESQGMFWVNMPDLASSTENIQVQRGVGTSTNGAAAFGATINLQTMAIRRDPYAEILTGGGSFNTLKNTVLFGTGLLANNWSFDGRLSRVVSDGFIDRASSNLRSYYLSASYFGKKSILKLNQFSGQEITYQAWNGIPEPKVKGDAVALMDYVNLLGEDSVHLANSGNRTYNSYRYRDEVDNYRQTHYQAHYTYQVNPLIHANVSLHYTRGKGYFEQYRFGEKLANYNLPDVIIGTDTVRKTDLVRRRWLDNHFYGAVFNFQYRDSKKNTLIFGGGWNEYRGKHFGEVIWARYASTSENDTRYYDNDAVKSDFNLYLKGEKALLKKLTGFLDLQYRQVGYSFLGFNNLLQNVQQGITYHFFNPKIGLNYEINRNQTAYLSYSQANREPVRDDFTQSTPETRPKPEQLHDFEAGYRLESDKWLFNLTAYWMQYSNQLILTGKVNDVGAYTRVNVPSSFRRGIEVDFSVNLFKGLQWNANVALSQNQVGEFTEYVDNWDDGSQQANTYKSTDLALSLIHI